MICPECSAWEPSSSSRCRACHAELGRSEPPDLEPAANGPVFEAYLARVRTLTMREYDALGSAVSWAYSGDGIGFGSGFDRIARARHRLDAGIAGRHLRAQVREALAASPAGQARGVDGVGLRYLYDLAVVYAVPEEQHRAAGNQDACEDLLDPWRRTVLHGLSLRDVRWWHVAIMVAIGVCIAYPAVGLIAGAFIVIAVVFGVSAFTLLYFLRGY